MSKYKLFSIGDIVKDGKDKQIVIKDRFRPALLHTCKFSHFIILWINSNKTNTINYPAEFKFAIDDVNSYSLSQINLTVVKSIHIDEVSGIISIEDAIIHENALIVDIKPYFPVEDRIKECAVPDKYLSLPDYISENIGIFASNTAAVSMDIEGNHPETFVDIVQNGTILKGNGKCFIEMTGYSKTHLDYLKDFSHVQILWWFNRFEKDNYRKITQCDPPYENAPKTGIFASRSPVRPNPVGLTTAKILKIDYKNKRIEISMIDAFDKTPVLDIKPYIPCFNRVKKYTIPEWVDHWSEWYQEQTIEASAGNNILAQSDYYKLSEFSDIRAANRGTYSKFYNTNSSENIDDGFISIIGAKENNLKNISLKIPKNKITVITGLSGSGKSSLAFDTIYAESQRRFMDTISSTGRQYFKQFERPRVDQILNLPTAIAVEQKPIGKNIRSTVGTVSDINDYLRLLFARIGIRHCPKCGRAIEVKSYHEIIDLLLYLKEGSSFNIVALKNNSIKGHFVVPLSSDINRYAENIKVLIKNLLDNESGVFKLVLDNGDSFILHTRNHCFYCGVSFFELTPSFFSSNNPESMCQECDGLGTKMIVSPELVVSNSGKSILDGASEWWGELRKYIEKPTGNWMKGEIIALAANMDVNLEMPWCDLSDDFKHKALYGTDGEAVRLFYKGSNGRSGDICRPVEGAISHINRLFRNSHCNGNTEFYMQFMEKTVCHVCQGEQLSPEARFVTVCGVRFPEVSAMSIDSLYEWIKLLPEKLSETQLQISGDIINSILSKTEALINVGLNYLTLKRTLPSLSGGEAQRLRLSAQLSCGLSNLLYILDEPSIGLHKSDQYKMIDTMKRLRDSGNTLIIVEHDAATMLAADYLIDIGPGAGINGGHIVAEGEPEELMGNKSSITGRYLCRNGVHAVVSGRSKRKSYGFLTIKGANKNNLKNIDVKFPLGTFICITGKSGSGKSSLITKTLSPVLKYYCEHKVTIKGDFDSIDGIEGIDNIVTITQEPIGRTPRSNPATYTGIFDEIRNIFASTPAAKLKKYSSSRFSFNSKDGCCEVCGGDGRKKIEMNFMPDIWITCPHCYGKRFNADTLHVTYKNKSIADILDVDIDEASGLFKENEKITKILDTLKDVGLGYLKLGQSAVTLSGGEAQRLKLSKELSKQKNGKTLYILDEPATGLHFSDIDNLLTLIHRIVDAGNTIIVIEHNTDIINNADWIIDLGPEGGGNGGYVMYQGERQSVGLTLNN